MTPVNRQDPCNVQTLRHRRDARINKIYIAIVVFAKYFRGAKKVGWFWRDQFKLACRKPS